MRFRMEGLISLRDVVARAQIRGPEKQRGPALTTDGAAAFVAADSA